MAAADAIACSQCMESQKMIKNWREAVKYLHNVDRTRFLRRSGSVFTLNMVALRQEMENPNAGQRQGSEIAVGCCSCGAAHRSCLQHGGNRKAKRQRQRAKRERFRDERTV